MIFVCPTFDINSDASLPYGYGESGDVYAALASSRARMAAPELLEVLLEAGGERFANTPPALLVPRIWASDSAAKGQTV